MNLDQDLQPLQTPDPWNLLLSAPPISLAPGPQNRLWRPSGFGTTTRGFLAPEGPKGPKISDKKETEAKTTAKNPNNHENKREGSATTTKQATAPYPKKPEKLLEKSQKKYLK